MAERKETIIYRYDGKCPECGLAQYAGSEKEADRVCNDCRKTCANKTFMEKLDFLRGARIIDFKGECHLNRDGSLSRCAIESMTVTTKDRRILHVTTDRGLWRAVEQ